VQEEQKTRWHVSTAMRTGMQKKEIWLSTCIGDPKKEKPKRDASAFLIPV
jgi:hypothetical protein